MDCRSCKISIHLQGGTFDLKSELRKGTEVTVTLPRQRVLNAIAPLQPLGQERHRDPAPRPTRQPRMRTPALYGSDTPLPLRRLHDSVRVTMFFLLLLVIATFGGLLLAVECGQHQHRDVVRAGRLPPQ